MPTTQANPYLDGNFAPHPDGKDKDDGWLITFVHNSKEETSEIVNLRSPFHNKLNSDKRSLFITQ